MFGFDIIKKDIQKNRLANAYLIVGNLNDSLDVMKKVSMYMNCLDKSVNDVCGVCKNCQRILSLNHPDVIVVEPSGKGNFIKISDIQEIQELICLKPVEVVKRICIFKNIEKMDIEAANSFLKSLEEPPSGTLFLISAVNIHNVLDTIVSRCRRIFIKQSKPFDIREEINIKEDYIFDIRDKILNIICENIAKEDCLDELDNINKVIRKKSSVKQHSEIILDFIESFIRDLVIFKETNENINFVFNKDKIDLIKNNFKIFSFDKINKMIKKIIDAKMELNLNPNFKIMFANILL